MYPDVEVGKESFTMVRWVGLPSPVYDEDGKATNCCVQW